MKFSLDTTVGEIPGILEDLQKKFPERVTAEVVKRFGVASMSIRTLLQKIQGFQVGSCAFAHEVSGDLYADCPLRHTNAACGHMLLTKNVPSAASLLTHVGAAICDKMTTSNAVTTEVLGHAQRLDAVDMRAMGRYEHARSTPSPEALIAGFQPIFEAERKEIGVRALKTNAEIVQRLQELFGGQYS